MFSNVRWLMSNLGKNKYIVRSLKVLDLSHNSMVRLDNGISNLRKLEMINLSHNNLVEDRNISPP